MRLRLLKHIRGTLLAVTTAAVYVRISDDPEGRALGVDRQRQDCLARAEREGWKVKHFEENDTGASDLSRKPRPQYDAMIEAAQQGQIQVILSYSNSRLTRRPRDLEDLILLHERTKVRLATIVSGDDDLSTADGRMVARIKASVDAAEAQRISERVKRAHLATLSSGKPLLSNRRPFGWVDNTMQAPHPVESFAIQEAVADLLDGGLLQTIVKRWNRSGLRTTTGKAWTNVTCRAVLLRWSNVAVPVQSTPVAGTKNKRVTAPLLDIQGLWTPLLKREDFDSLRLHFLNRPAQNKREARKYLLTNIMRCSKCGSLMRGGSGRYNCAGEYTGLCSMTLKPSIADGRILDYVADRLAHLAGTEQKTIVSRQARRDVLEQSIYDLGVERQEIASDPTLNTSSKRALLRDLDVQENALRERVNATVATSVLTRILTDLMPALHTEFRAEDEDNDAREVHRVVIGGHESNVRAVRAALDDLELDRQRAVVRAFGNYTVHPWVSHKIDRIHIEPLDPDLSVLEVEA